ncbi:hypothetical protein D9M71_226680 [compost metagenome]
MLALTQEVIGREQVISRLVTGQDFARHGDFVHLGRAVGQAEEERVDHAMHERHLVGYTDGAVQVQGTGSNIVEQLGHGGFHRRDVLAHPFVVLVLVDQPGGTQYQQAELFQFDPAVSDFLLDHLLAGQLLALGHPGQDALAEHVENGLGFADGAHRMVNAATTETGLGHHEGLTDATENMVCRHPYIVETHVGVSVDFL